MYPGQFDHGPFCDCRLAWTNHGFAGQYPAFHQQPYEPEWNRDYRELQPPSWDAYSRYPAPYFADQGFVDFAATDSYAFPPFTAHHGLPSPWEVPQQPQFHQYQTPRRPASLRDSCIFCRIFDGKEENEIFYQDEDFVAFADHRPVARHHLLVVTRNHIRDVLSLRKDDLPKVQGMVDVGMQVLAERGADLNDSRLGFHVPPRTTVPHIHLHVISPASTLSLGEKKRFGLNTTMFMSAQKVFQHLSDLSS
ncbi:adenosine 5'-monophosphoramidase HINT3-like [Neocloeon triangulifer]|uniref:adenosine 5'-monophosphoramidase HINT3-like n=1 Tax=Neocloeon triangulifer TaxID=2078957 RepID=UPI00286F3A7C|nr:adenosine 5'-monophosphoramidase HINT3-like [Neocloeon triangulifer]